MQPGGKVVSIPFYDALSCGCYPKMRPWSKTGYNAAVGTSTEDLWPAGGTYVWPAVAGIRMEVISTGAGAANDAAAGSGIQQVRLGYLDNNYVEQSEIITMNGVGAVGTTAVNIARVQTFRAYRVGGSTGAAGTILLRLFGGGATYTQISVGLTRARNQCWCVPAGKKLHVTSMVMSTGSNAGGRDALFTTRATYDDSSGALLTPGIFFMPYHEIQLEDAAFYRQLEIPTTFPAKVDIKVSCIASADVSATSVLRGYLETL